MISKISGTIILLAAIYVAIQAVHMNSPGLGFLCFALLIIGGNLTIDIEFI